MIKAATHRVPAVAKSAPPRQQLREQLARAGLFVADGIDPPTVSRSISLDQDLDAELDAWLGRGGKSRFLNAAARDALVRVRIAERLARLEETEGPITDDLRAEVAQLPRPR